MATYYVSEAGDDQNDGLSPQTAWATTRRAAEAEGGSTILFNRGDTFYGSFHVPPSNDPDCPTVIGAFGAGAKPQICLYRIVTDPAAWEEVGRMRYRIRLTDQTKYGGNRRAGGNNVGFIKVGNRIWGWRCFAMSDIRSMWDFYCNYDDGYLYVMCPRNPCEYGAIYLADGDCGVVLDDNCVVSDLDIFGGGCHGMMSGHDDRGFARNIVVRDCDIHDFGGSHLKSEQYPNVRFGNGIELWDGAENVLVEGCRIWNIYDVAITMQGFPKEGKGWKNVVFRHNLMWGNQQSFEIWTQPGDRESGMYSCRFTDNICIGSGYGWSYGPRPGKFIGTHVMIQMTMVGHHDILVENNVFYDVRDVLYYKSTDGDMPPDFVSRNNRIFVRPDTFLMDMKYCYRATEFERFQTEQGLERGSEIHYLPDVRAETLSQTIEQLSNYWKE